MDTLLEHIITELKAEGNPEIAVGMKAYMRDKFEFLGITAPLRKALSAPILKEISTEPKAVVYPLIAALWKRPEREFHYLAQEIMLKVSKKMLEKEDLPFITWLITENSWWDTVDFIAPKIVLRYFEKFPDMRDSTVDVWIDSDHIWLQRSALLFQLKQKDEVDLNFMFASILRLTGSSEFFINKAIGWLLREHSKRIPLEIRDFITENETILSPLSIREGSKYC